MNDLKRCIYYVKLVDDGKNTLKETNIQVFIWHEK